MTKYEITLQKIEELENAFNEEMKSLELEIELLEDEIFEINFEDYYRVEEIKQYEEKLEELEKLKEIKKVAHEEKITTLKNS